MEMLKFGKFAALALAMAVAVGCSSKGGDNAGEGAVNRYRGVPPYAETRGYVRRILSIFKKDVHPYNPEITTPSPDLPKIRVANAT